MRRLTIKRTKSFVASLIKVQVFIEDPLSNEIAINDVPCRKLGTLKNGEEATFDISENSARVFVICDKLSKNYCNDFYQLEAGTEDIFLSGKSKYNPASGNAFRFDNNDNPEALANRKKGTRKGLIVLILAVVVGAVCGFLSGYNSDSPTSSTPTPKSFSCEGMSILLTDEFFESDMESSYTAVYDSENVAVFALKEDFSLIEGAEDYSIEKYGEAVLTNNTLTDTQLNEKDGLTYFTYEAANPETDIEYSYYSFVFKGTDAFWLIQFATLSEKEEAYSSQIFEWAKTISFTE